MLVSHQQRAIQMEAFRRRRRFAQIGHSQNPDSCWKNRSTHAANTFAMSWTRKCPAGRFENAGPSMTAKNSAGIPVAPIRCRASGHSHSVGARTPLSVGLYPPATDASVIARDWPGRGPRQSTYPSAQSVDEGRNVYCKTLGVWLVRGCGTASLRGGTA